METKIIKQETNPFLEREEFLIEIISNSAPTKESVVSELGKDSELTVVKKIHTNFGRTSFLADVIVYNSIEAKEKYTMIPKKVRIRMETERKEKEAAEKKATEEAKVAEETTKETTSEETKEEQPKETQGEETKVEENKEETAPEGVPSAQMASSDEDKEGKENKE